MPVLLLVRVPTARRERLARARRDHAVRADPALRAATFGRHREREPGPPAVDAPPHGYTRHDGSPVAMRRAAAAADARDAHHARHAPARTPSPRHTPHARATPAPSRSSGTTVTTIRARFTGATMGATRHAAHTSPCTGQLQTGHTIALTARPTT